ncbi:hypothetical protein AAHA92_19521 [Salvia divinorum]|uniref:Bifunctional inhibitor/plant lipid transfer protein/seed storage helical domain-containing protein n=1 Tax=Salvia divinorum TaxID=28513 RepID=A0ABD1FGP2_SALDI
MESLYKKIAILSVFIVILEGATAQTICNITMKGFSECKPAATPPIPPPPSAACCSVLSKADLKCLCSHKNSTILPSLGVDPELAVHLPEKCNIPNPPKC